MGYVLSKERVAEVEAFFADNGEFPAAKIDKRRWNGLPAFDLNCGS